MRDIRFAAELVSVVDIKRMILNALFYHAVSRGGIEAREILMDSGAPMDYIILCV